MSFKNYTIDGQYEDVRILWRSQLFENSRNFDQRRGLKYFNFKDSFFDDLDIEKPLIANISILCIESWLLASNAVYKYFDAVSNDISLREFFLQKYLFIFKIRKISFQYKSPYSYYVTLVYSIEYNDVNYSLYFEPLFAILAQFFVEKSRNFVFLKKWWTIHKEKFEREENVCLLKRFSFDVWNLRCLQTFWGQ